VGNLVGVGHVREAGAEIQELADALREHAVNHPLEQMAALIGGVPGARDTDVSRHRVHRVGCVLVDREVVLAAEVVVPDARCVGKAGTYRVIGIQFGGCRWVG
jgi:hypothetical protein